MKTITLKNVLVITLLVSATMFSACKGKKSTTETNSNSTSTTTPCKKEGKSDADYFRANASATSNDMNLSREKALATCKQSLMRTIETKFKSTTSRFITETGLENNTDFEQTFVGITQEVANMKIANTTVTCEKNYQGDDGKYTTHLAIELGKEEMITGLNDIVSKNKKLRVNYDQMKYQEIFNEEMKKFEQ